MGIAKSKEVQQQVVTSYVLLRINSFASLPAPYRSPDFSFGGCNWNLLLYPHGDKENDVNDHMSLYLVIGDTSFLQLGWKVKVDYKFFGLDMLRNCHLRLGDARREVGHFHALKTKWGSSRLIPIKTFKDRSNGYLVNDACAFGIEIFSVHVFSGTGCYPELKKSLSIKYTWKIQNFLEFQDYVASDILMTGSYKWKIYLASSGDGENKDFCTWLHLANADSLIPGVKLYVQFTCYLRSIKKGKDIACTGKAWVSKEERECNFISSIGLVEIKDSKNGYLVNNKITIKAYIAVLGYEKQLQKKKRRETCQKRVAVGGEQIKLTCPICRDNMKEETSTNCGHIFLALGSRFQC